MGTKRESDNGQTMISSTTYCVRACSDPLYCPTTYDEMGCYFLTSNGIGWDGVYQDCVGDDGDPPGVYVDAGGGEDGDVYAGGGGGADVFDTGGAGVYRRGGGVYGDGNQHDGGDSDDIGVCRPKRLCEFSCTDGGGGDAAGGDDADGQCSEGEQHEHQHGRGESQGGACSARTRDRSDRMDRRDVDAYRDQKQPRRRFGV